MTREEFKKAYYEETGKWLSEEELDTYIKCLDYDELSTDYQYHKQNTNNQLEHIYEPNFHTYNEDDIFDDNLADEFSKIFFTVANKVKLSLQEKKESENLESELAEFIFYGELFLAKSFLYFILKKGIKKGYKW